MVLLRDSREKILHHLYYCEKVLYNGARSFGGAFIPMGVVNMIRVIMGDKGSGKTKRLIDMANDLVKEAKGDIVYVDDDQRYMYDLRHEIRFIETSEHKAQKAYCAQWLYGFIGGILATNFDVSSIFIDAFVKHIGGTLDALEVFFSRLETLSAKYGVDFVLSIGVDAKEVPEHIQKFAI
jgi:energy-coupling factor transporter ATP-binding protein EcfA2